jgi:hypothetical protein
MLLPPVLSRQALNTVAFSGISVSNLRREHNDVCGDNGDGDDDDGWMDGETGQGEKIKQKTWLETG